MKTPREILLDQHRSAERRLREIRESVLNNVNRPAAFSPHFIALKLWRELFQPCRFVWAGIAAAWIVIIAYNISMNRPSGQVAREFPASDPEVREVLKEQQQLLTQLLETAPPDFSRDALPGPRTEKLQPFALS